MDLFEIILLGLGLALDGFAVSISKGLSIKKLNWKKVFIMAACFGAFHIVMPVVGYFLGSAFDVFVQNVDHWIAFILLTIIGVNMIRESFDKEEKDDKMDFKSILILALATSIDSLAVGVTFAFFETNLILAISVIGIITFLLSLMGVIIGKKFGDKLKNKAEIMGGIILITIGIKVLLEHLKFFPFN